VTILLSMILPVGYARRDQILWADGRWNLWLVSLLTTLFILAVGAPGLLKTWTRWLSVYVGLVALLGAFLLLNARLAV